MRARLIVLLTAVMAMVFLFSMQLVLQQHRIATRAANSVIAEHERMARASDMRELLNQIDRTFRTGALSPSDLARFRQLVSNSRVDAEAPEIQNALASVDDGFNLYVQSLESPSIQIARDRFEGVEDAIDHLTSVYQTNVFKTAEDLRLERERAFGRTALFLLAFIVLTIWAGIRALDMISGPVSLLINRLDEVNPEVELPAEMPLLNSHLPEVARMARSFDRLVQRLRGYRALNVHRLLIEKRRADLLAASITDGIILLRNDEIVYANPTGEQILGLSPGTASRGLRLSTLIAASHAGRGEGGTDGGKSQAPIVIGMAPAPAVESSGPRAIAEAVSRTIPTELAVTLGDDRKYYLIQASPVSFDLAETMESSLRAASNLEPNDETGTAEINRMLQRFQANTLVVAQDVTIVRKARRPRAISSPRFRTRVKTPVTSLTMATRLLKRKSLDQIANATASRRSMETCVGGRGPPRGVFSTIC